MEKQEFDPASVYQIRPSGSFGLIRRCVWIVTAFLGRLGATVGFKLFRFDVVASHLAAGAHRRPQAAVVGSFNRMRVRTLRAET